VAEDLPDDRRRVTYYAECPRCAVTIAATAVLELARLVAEHDRECDDAAPTCGPYGDAS